MRSTIIETIAKIEQEKNIKVLFACETGSRAWGFPSPDSDYDVRMIYKHERNWYLTISEKKDTIETMLNDGDLDITGWDIRKCLRLLWKSNGALLERLQSPIVYCEEPGFLELMKLAAETCFSPIATIYHYLHMGKNSFDDVKDEEEVKLKKLFYALRAAFACKWILDKGTTPPIVFQTMLHELDINPALTKRIEDLIELKSEKNESYIHPKEALLNAFIAEQFLRAENESNSLKSRSDKRIDLDELFLQLLGEK